MSSAILLIVSASVAGYKAAEATRRLRDRGAEVQVMMTPAARKLVGAATFRALSGRPVLTDEWRHPAAPDGMDHIAAVRWANALLAAPATADFIAKAANGICDNLPLAAFAAADCPKFIAPAMNAKMWQNPPTARNVAQLVQDGVFVLGPASGEQACGETGPGRMLEVDDIVDQLLAKLSELSESSASSASSEAGWLAGKRIVVSAGATVEKLDPMRVVTNVSSGRMGFAVAEAARRAGGEVVVVAGQTWAPPPAGVRLRRALTGEDMRAAVLAETAAADAFVATAAVADFRPKRGRANKTPRETPSAKPLMLELVPTADILAETVRRRPGVLCVGFAAENGETAHIVAAARRKMRKKGAGMFAANSVADAGRDDCQLTLLVDDETETLPRQPKAVAARRLVAKIAEILAQRPMPRAA